MTEEARAPGGLLKDHQGKTSNIRVVSLLSATAAIILALAPLWNGPTTDMQTLLVLLVGPGGLKVWQAIAAEKK